MSVNRSLAYSLVVLFTSADTRSIWTSLSFLVFYKSGMQNLGTGTGCTCTRQGRLNNIIDPRAKQCNGAYTYPSTNCNGR